MGPERKLSIAETDQIWREYRKLDPAPHQ
jgi:hypothetical protein